MESNNKCFEAVSSAVEIATSQFSLFWKINDERYSILKEYCEAIDAVAEEFEGKSIEASVNENNMTISIKMECEDISIMSHEDKYYKLIQRTISLGFAAANNGNLLICLVFPSIWERSY